MKKTFTLIEMLIVIVIIGILASALIPRLTAVQGRARDTKRKVDLRTIANANEIWRVDNGRYIQAVNGSYTCSYNAIACFTRSLDTQPWISGLQTILTTIPVDPVNNSVPYATGGYGYVYGNVFISPNFETFDLAANLENPLDPDRCGVKRYKYAGKTNGSSVRCNFYPQTMIDFGPGAALSGSL